ncbi:MAG: ATP-dependent sacrificial sulfur transferase LarE [Candidatus Bathyarchaeia archaeon]
MAKFTAKREVERLVGKLKSKKGILVALSGGVDSSVVAALAKIAVGDKALAVTTSSLLLPPGEIENAKRIAREIGIRHVIVEANELSNRGFVANPTDRCYYCKKELIGQLREIAEREGLETIVEGTNAEDLKSHRPGAKALEEEAVNSPLAEAGLNKAQVREIASYLGLSVAEKPSMACLASRIPYGDKITEGKLRRIGRAEEIVRDLTEVRQLRVRDHGTIARIEVGREERRRLFDVKLLDRIVKELKYLGYRYVTMDVEGYRTGSMNEQNS